MEYDQVASISQVAALIFFIVAILISLLQLSLTRGRNAL